MATILYTLGILMIIWVSKWLLWFWGLQLEDGELVRSMKKFNFQISFLFSSFSPLSFCLFLHMFCFCLFIFMGKFVYLHYFNRTTDRFRDWKLLILINGRLWNWFWPRRLEVKFLTMNLLLLGSIFFSLTYKNFQPLRRINRQSASI